MLTRYKTILWDFDGVILDSMAIRDEGFELIFSSYPKEDVNQLLNFHRKNGGLSRYVKIRFFYEQVLKKDISEEKINAYATSFSNIMRKKLVLKENLIEQTVEYLKLTHKSVNYHIVSGSDQKELRFLCKELNLESFFISIHGSPTPKNQLVHEILSNYSYSEKETGLIGDSKNDYEAALGNGIDFFGYNNPDLKPFGTGYINSFDELNQ